MLSDSAMPVFWRMLLLLDWFVAVSWMMRVLQWRLGMRRVADLRQADSVGQGKKLPSMTAIVPARNEAETIAATLSSLLASEGVSLQIIAVDDRSTDETGALMDRLALKEAAIEVLHVTELPPGWLGKTHAMAMGALRARGEWLLFTDGDVIFHPEALRRALAFATSSGGDHMVLMPTILLGSWGERMMISFLQVLSIWAIRPWRVADRRARRDAIGVGAFNLLRREVYAAIGGWQALRLEVVEDLALGRRIKEHGYAQRVATGVDMVKVRWARGAFGVIENLTKNLFALFRFRPELVFAFAAGLTLFTWFPVIACVGGSRMWWPTATVVIALFLAYQQMGRYHQYSAAQLLLFPAAAVLLLYALLRSTFLALWRGGISWRGTFYSLKELRRGGTAGCLAKH